MTTTPTMPLGRAVRSRPARRVGRFAAVDLGATSGRVIVAEIDAEGAGADSPATPRSLNGDRPRSVAGEPRSREGAVRAGRFALTEIHRFANAPVSREGHLRWDFEAIWANVVEGLRRAAATGPIDSVGIDTWGADYGLLGADGSLLDSPFCYRDRRTEGVPERVWDRIGPRRLYELTGSQYQRFNTVFQLAAEPAERLAGARSLLLMPELLAHRLTGRVVAESTSASTTGLFDVRRRSWSDEAIDALALDRGLFADVLEPGDGIGQLTPQVQAATGLGPGTMVVAVGGHDTASAVAAVPASGTDFAYVSSGTWSLVGVERAEPVLSRASQDANFTNELGVFGRVRHLKNVMGLWLLSECQRDWAERGACPALPELLAAAAAEPPGQALIDADHDQFLAPGDMPRRIARAVSAGGGRVPTGRAQTVRCIIDSLAASYDRAVRQASALSGQAINRVHIVGGGSLNALLCQATADSTGLPVLAGPTEASVIGNAAVQAHAMGVIDGGLEQVRALVADHFPVTAYGPGESAGGQARSLHGARCVGGTDTVQQDQDVSLPNQPQKESS
ncbi:MAG: rhamnulokinase [Bifidobacteriaceae bacterium]|jgi:rhamnulokinase|nr:rhamnulokinase [Bifidobacteriaceae bacterium]